MKQLTLPGLEKEKKKTPNNIAEYHTNKGIKKNPLDKFTKDFAEAYNTYEDDRDNIIVGPGGQLIMESELKKMEEKAHPNIDFDKVRKKIAKPLPPKQNYTDTYKILKASASKDELKTFPDEIEKAKARKVIKKANKVLDATKNITVPNFDPLPLAASTNDSRADYLEQRFNKMVEEKKQEDIRNSTQGVMSLNAYGILLND